MNDIYDVIKNAEKIFNNKYTSFLDVKLQKLVRSKLGKTKYQIYLPYQDSEKVIYYTSDIPKVSLYEIKVKDIITHRDILGALFSLGIDSSMYGDIVVKDNHYYIFILDIIENYLFSHLLMIKNSKVELEKKAINFLDNHQRQYETIELVVSSVRLDSVISSIIQVKRDDVASKIKEKDILVNYDIVKSSYKLKNNDIISIRKYGKYSYKGIIKTTKKNNYVIRVDKYI